MDSSAGGEIDRHRHKSAAAADNQYWNELDGWVWDDDEAKKKPAAILG